MQSAYVHFCGAWFKSMPLLYKPASPLLIVIRVKRISSLRVDKKILCLYFLSHSSEKIQITSPNFDSYMINLFSNYMSHCRENGGKGHLCSDALPCIACTLSLCLFLFA